MARSDLLINQSFLRFFFPKNPSSPIMREIDHSVNKYDQLLHYFNP